jgi:hypothetical protein
MSEAAGTLVAKPLPKSVIEDMKFAAAAKKVKIPKCVSRYYSRWVFVFHTQVACSSRDGLG